MGWNLATNEQEHRLEGINLFTKLLQAQPELLGKSPNGQVAAEEVIEASELLMSYILEGKKP